MSPLLKSLSLLVVVFLGYNLWQTRSVHQPAGILVPEEPAQTMYPENQPTISVAGLILKPLASYKIRGRIIGTERYFFDREAEIAPVDVCLAWGLLSANGVLDYLSFSQSGRFCYYKWKGAPPAPPDTIISHVANTHIIPAEPWIKKTINDLRPGEIVTLEGDLVEAQWPDARRWRSSLVRTDTGYGACELMYVRSIFRP